MQELWRRRLSADAPPKKADANDNEMVRVADGEFMIGDSVYRFVGVNMWYGAILGSEGAGATVSASNASLIRLRPSESIISESSWEVTAKRASHRISRPFCRQGRGNITTHCCAASTIF